MMIAQMIGQSWADLFTGDCSLRHAKATALRIRLEDGMPLDEEDVRVLYRAGAIDIAEFERLLALALEREGDSR